MSTNRHLTRGGLLAAATLTSLGILLVIILQTRGADRDLISGTNYPLDEDRPVVISASLEILPPEAVVQSAQARLLTRDTIYQWYGFSPDPNGDDEWLEEGAYWLVGIEASPLQMLHSSALAPGVYIDDDTTPIPGLYFIWDAIAAEQVAIGPMWTNASQTTPTSSATIETLTALQDDDVSGYINE